MDLKIEYVKEDLDETIERFNEEKVAILGLIIADAVQFARLTKQETNYHLGRVAFYDESKSEKGESIDKIALIIRPDVNKKVRVPAIRCALLNSSKFIEEKNCETLAFRGSSLKKVEIFDLVCSIAELCPTVQRVLITNS